MFIARTVVIVAPGAGGIAASSASRINNEFSAPGMTATLAVARPAIADRPPPASKTAPAATASMPLARRVTAQK